MTAASRLRERAAELRSVARRFGTIDLTLGGLAGPDTWRGPGPDVVAALLPGIDTSRDGAVSELESQARSLDRLAEAAEREAALALQAEALRRAQAAGSSAASAPAGPLPVTS